MVPGDGFRIGSGKGLNIGLDGLNKLNDDRATYVLVLKVRRLIVIRDALMSHGS